MVLLVDNNNNNNKIIKLIITIIIAWITTTTTTRVVTILRHSHIGYNSNIYEQQRDAACSRDVKDSYYVCHRLRPSRGHWWHHRITCNTEADNTIKRCTMFDCLRSGIVFREMNHLIWGRIVFMYSLWKVLCKQVFLTYIYIYIYIFRLLPA